MKQTDNIQYLDTLRATATIAVILIHISSPVLGMAFRVDMNSWITGNIFDSSVRFAVPLFLMLSGATLLHRDYPPGEFYKKRLMRVLLPFLFWILVYWVYYWLMLPPVKQPHGFGNITHWAVNLFLNDGVSKHFWYVYMILFLYLFTPFIGKTVRKMNRKTLSFTLLIWVAICISTYSLNLSFYKWTGDYQYKLLGYIEYSGYLVSGYYLSKYDLFRNKQRLIAGIVYLLSIVVCAWVVYSLSYGQRFQNLRIYSYFSIVSIVQSVAVFLLFKNAEIRNKSLLFIQKRISNYSYGIYLVHIIVIGVLFRNGIYWSFANPVVSLPVLLILVLTISMSIIYGLRKIPGFRYITG